MLLLEGYTYTLFFILVNAMVDAIKQAMGSFVSFIFPPNQMLTVIVAIQI
jgi:hypothetical protein